MLMRRWATRKRRALRSAETAAGRGSCRTKGRSAPFPKCAGDHSREPIKKKVSEHGPTVVPDPLFPTVHNRPSSGPSLPPQLVVLGPRYKWKRAQHSHFHPARNCSFRQPPDWLKIRHRQLLRGEVSGSSAAAFPGPDFPPLRPLLNRGGRSDMAMGLAAIASRTVGRSTQRRQCSLDLAESERDGQKRARH